MLFRKTKHPLINFTNFIVLGYKPLFCFFLLLCGYWDFESIEYWSNRYHVFTPHTVLNYHNPHQPPVIWKNLIYLFLLVVPIIIALFLSCIVNKKFSPELLILLENPYLENTIPVCQLRRISFLKLSYLVLICVYFLFILKIYFPAFIAFDLIIPAAYEYWYWFIRYKKVYKKKLPCF